MLTLSVRQFQLKASEYLKKLPLTLTVYGKPVAIVNTFEDVRQDVRQEEFIEETSTAPKKTTQSKGELYGWCQMHFEKGASYPLTKVTWEDENGVPMIKEKLVCPSCLTQLEGRDTGHLYIL